MQYALREARLNVKVSRKVSLRSVGDSTTAAVEQYIRDGCFAIAEKKGHLISTLSVMPDHLHIALRGNISHSAQEIALAFLNNLAYGLGQAPYWQFGYYPGTFEDHGIYSVRGGKTGAGQDVGSTE